MHTISLSVIVKGGQSNRDARVARVADERDRHLQLQTRIMERTLNVPFRYVPTSAVCQPKRLVCAAESSIPRQQFLACSIGRSRHHAPLRVARWRRRGAARSSRSVAPRAMSCRPLSRAISASSPAFRTADLRRRPVNCCALANKALSMSSVGMCMTMAPSGGRHQRARTRSAWTSPCTLRSSASYRP